MIKVLMIIILLCWEFHVAAQPSEQVITANAQALADKIASKMKDSLDLSMSQAARVKAVNLKLHDEKMEMRRQHSDTSDLGKYLQHVENKRDSLYKVVLTEPQFILYRQKKCSLVSAN